MGTTTSQRTRAYPTSAIGNLEIDFGVSDPSFDLGELANDDDEFKQTRSSWRRGSTASSAGSGLSRSLASPLAFLTPREEEILGLLCEGRSGSEIEEALSLKPSTVRSHIHSLLTKLRVHSRLEAVAFALQHGFHPRASSPPLPPGKEPAARNGWIPEVTPVAVILVDPRRAPRRFIGDRLSRDRRLRVVAEMGPPGSASPTVPLIAARVAIVSGMGDSEGLPSMVARVRRHLPSCGIVLVGESEDPGHLLRVLDAGVRGYVLARESHEQLVEATQAVARGEVPIPRHMYEPLVHYLLESRLAQHERRARLSRLTKRELQVLQLLVEGGSNESIAQKLDVSVDTARTHVQRILQKLGVHSRVAAAALAANHG